MVYSKPDPPLHWFILRKDGNWTDREQTALSLYCPHSFPGVSRLSLTRMWSCHQSRSMSGPFAKYAVKGANEDQLLNSYLVEMGQLANHFEPKSASTDSRGCCLRQGGEIRRGGETAGEGRCLHFSLSHSTMISGYSCNNRSILYQCLQLPDSEKLVQQSPALAHHWHPLKCAHFNEFESAVLLSGERQQWKVSRLHQNSRIQTPTEYNKWYNTVLSA